MFTIRRHVPKRYRFDPVVECSICGLEDYRSRMERLPGGALACRLDMKGRDEFELDEANAENARAATERRPYLDEDGGTREDSE